MVQEVGEPSNLEEDVLKTLNDHKILPILVSGNVGR